LTTLKKALPAVPHFSKPVELVTLPLHCTENETVIAEFPNIVRNEKFRECHVLVQEVVRGISFRSLIDTADTEVPVMSVIFQGLAALDCAQTLAEYTHHDLHIENWRLAPCDPELVFLFDVVKERPLAVHSTGHIATVIDGEFGHVKEMDGNYVDCSFELLERGFDPTSFDPGCDSIRFLLCTLNKFSMNRPERFAFRKMAVDLQRKVNSASAKYGTFDEAGVLQAFSLQIHLEFCNSPSLTKDFTLTDANFLRNNFYRILGLLTHHVTIPLENKVTSPSMIPLISMLKHLFSIETLHPEIKLRILYEISLVKDPSHIILLLAQQGISVDSAWVLKLTQYVKQCVPHVVTTLYYATRENRIRKKLQNMDSFNAANMIEWMMERYQLILPYTRKTTVKWIGRENAQDVSLSLLTDAQLEWLNSERDMRSRSVRLKSLVSQLVVR
jgi:hypothetical protein